MKLKQYGPQLKDLLRGIWAHSTAEDHMIDRGSEASVFVLVGGQPRGHPALSGLVC